MYKDIVIIVLGVMLVVALIVFYTWLYITYGGKPIDEVPSWVLIFWFGKNN